MLQTARSIGFSPIASRWRMRWLLYPGAVVRRRLFFPTTG